MTGRMQELERITYDRSPHVDQARQTGVVFHLIGCLTELGRVGMTAAGDNADAARLSTTARN